MSSQIVDSASASSPPVHRPYDGPEDWYEGLCSVCGVEGRFVRDRMSISESYRCPACKGHLRYQGQGRAIVRAFARHGERSVAELVGTSTFRRLHIYEPGTLGPFRPLLRRLKGYVQSTFDVGSAQQKPERKVRREDLMDLSFEPMSFDLVITSDIFEHIRHPDRAFAEVYRVLRPGGWHIFTIPGRWPLRPHTVARVDVSGRFDVMLLPPVFHNRDHLVYNDFGLDLLQSLDRIGFATDPMLFASSTVTTSAQVTFCSRRPFNRDDVEAPR